MFAPLHRPPLSRRLDLGEFARARGLEIVLLSVPAPAIEAPALVPSQTHWHPRHLSLVFLTMAIFNLIKAQGGQWFRPGQERKVQCGRFVLTGIQSKEHLEKIPRRRSVVGEWYAGRIAQRERQRIEIKIVDFRGDRIR